MVDVEVRFAACADGDVGLAVKAARIQAGFGIDAADTDRGRKVWRVSAFMFVDVVAGITKSAS